MFVDEAKISVKAGNGGNGCRSFQKIAGRHYGRPTGGCGGKGGDVIIKADENEQTLLSFRYNKHFRAAAGANGGSNNKTGANGDDLLIKVPVGTIIRDSATRLLLKELNEAGLSVLIAKGGNGGRGNSPGHDAAQGEPGEEKELFLELKVMADVGIVGYPNAGKSTFISRVSHAKPKIANYPFTTKSPVLGVASVGWKSFIIADIPGLIEGAHEGRGLGDRFLRHVERTKVLLHLIDMAGVDGRDPCEDYAKLRKELRLYDPGLLKKTHIVAANKMDMPETKENLRRFRKKRKIRIHEISALTGQGVARLLSELAKKV